MSQIATLSNPSSITRIRSLLKYGPCACIFEAQGTRFDLVLCLSGSIADAEELSLNRQLLVAIVNFFRAAYCFPHGGLDGGYVAEKLRLRAADANNLAAFINAIFMTDAAAYLAKVCDPERPDQVEHAEAWRNLR